MKQSAKHSAKRGNRYRTIALILTILLLVSIVAAAFLGLTAYRFMRLNQFSKNIVLGDNYFLNNYMPLDNEPEETERENGYNLLELESYCVSQGVDWNIFFIAAAEYIQLNWGFPIFEADANAYDPPQGDWNFLTADDIQEIVALAYSLYPDLTYPIDQDAFLQGFLRNGTKLLQVPHLCQLPDYPNGCEAVSAVMLLQYYGFDISEKAFIEEYLIKEPVKISWGCRYGPDPKEAYAGEPATNNGWGCFAPVIVKSLQPILNHTSYQAVNLTGMSLDQLETQFLDRNIPVAIWTTIDFEPLKEVYQWQSYDKKSTYLYPKNQHCVVLIGYDSDRYFISDPLSDEKYSAVSKEKLQDSFHSVGAQSVALISTRSSNTSGNTSGS